ncbi:hypothetical protein E2C01_025516 [Portunus trituberculatus]|uniref:Uncharacterized protein n=1 Tax=Portunus trituberculatus TaxID=210409 RepID=A0A5B7EG58_PORTR|nr:hypothetical protein [Portunus trituberculatus]
MAISTRLHWWALAKSSNCVLYASQDTVLSNSWGRRLVSSLNLRVLELAVEQHDFTEPGGEKGGQEWTRMDKNAKTSVDATGLVKAMLEFQFVLGLHTLKIIFSNTNSLASYLRGHEVDVMATKATCGATIKILFKCREEEMFSLILEKA